MPTPKHRARRYPLRLFALALAAACPLRVEPAELNLEQVLQQADVLDTQDPQAALGHATRLLADPELKLSPPQKTRLLILQLDALRNLSRFAEAQTAAQALKAYGESLGDVIVQGKALEKLGLIAIDQNHFEQGLALLRNAKTLFETRGRQDDIASVENNIGIALRNLGRYPEAIAAYQKSLRLREQSGKPVEIARTLNNLGVTYESLGDYSSALAVQERALAIKRGLNDPAELSDSLYNLGSIYIHLNDTRHAVDYLRQSLDIDRQQGNRKNVAYGLTKLAELYRKEQDLEKARNAAREGLDLFRQLGAKRNVAWALGVLALVERDAGNLKLAITKQEEALAIAESIHNQERIALLRTELAESEFQQGNLERAFSLASTALPEVQTLGEKDLEQGLYALLSQVEEKRGHLAEALKYLNRRNDVHDQILNDERVRTITQMQSRLNDAQKEQEIALLKKDREMSELAVDRARFQRNAWLAGGSGSLLLVLLIASRILRQRQVGAQREIIEKLKRLDRLKDDFLANTSHELRTPLAGIVGLAQSLLDGASGELSAKAKDELRLITMSGHRLARLVNDVLDLSKIKDNRLALYPRPVDIRVAADIVLTLSQTLIGDKSLVLRNAIPEGTPAVFADEYRVQQILHNLIGNAIKFSESGIIRVDAEIDSAMLWITVSDQGIGIAPADQERIFSAFEQVDGSVSRRHIGTGLGLAIVRKLVELQGGKIEVHSTPGQGSRFRFSLPLSQQPANSASEAFQELAGIAAPLIDTEINTIDTTSGQRDFTILVVDDEAVNRHVLSNFLAPRFRVLTAGDGESALSLLQTQAIDLVLLDVMMPEQSGYAVCRRIREHVALNDLPIILLTAKNRVEDLVTGFGEGANDYLTKPIVRDELIARVELHLRLLDISRHLERKIEERTAELAEKNLALKQASETDFLTGLANRRAFISEAERIANTGHGYAIALCDVDNFKRINDRHGHECGDYVLSTIAEIFHRELRKHDLTARWGGEEFIVLLKQTDLDEARVVIEKLRAAIAAARFRYQDQELEITCTFGLRACGAGQTPLDDIIRQADAALYHGKRSGKNRVVHDAC